VKRARASIARQLPANVAVPPLPASQREQDLVARFTDAYERGDVGAIVSLLTADAKLTMPPEPFVYQGHAAIGDFLAAICAPRRLRLIPTRANGQPAFGCYLRDDASARLRAHGLLVITLAGDQVSEITRFLDNSVLPRFGLPRYLPG
jgi:RNA polymerase sigma-70 factor (ECF subfamily)